MLATPGRPEEVRGLIPPYNYQTSWWRVWFTAKAQAGRVTLVQGALNTQLAEEFFKIRFVDHDFARPLALRAGLDQAFIEGVEQAHLGHGIFL